MRLTDDPTHGEVRWSRDGTELFFRDGRHFFALPVKIDGARFERGQPVPLFEDRFARAPAPGWTNYNVTPDGRFLAMLEVESGPGDLSLIQNWRAMVAAAFDEE